MDKLHARLTKITVLIVQLIGTLVLLVILSAIVGAIWQGTRDSIRRTDNSQNILPTPMLAPEISASPILPSALIEEKNASHGASQEPSTETLALSVTPFPTPTAVAIVQAPAHIQAKYTYRNTPKEYTELIATYAQDPNKLFAIGKNLACYFNVDFTYQVDERCPTDLMNAAIQAKVLEPPDDAHTYVSYTRDREHVLLLDRDIGFILWRPKINERQILPIKTTDVQIFAISPDGKSVAYTQCMRAEQQCNLMLYTIATKQTKRIAYEDMKNEPTPPEYFVNQIDDMYKIYSIQWSPDSKYILYSRQFTGNTGAGSGARVVLVSPDGSTYKTIVKDAAITDREGTLLCHANPPSAAWADATTMRIACFNGGTMGILEYHLEKDEIVPIAIFNSKEGNITAYYHK